MFDTGGMSNLARSDLSAAVPSALPPALRELAEKIRPVTWAQENRFTVEGQLGELLGGGVQAGSVLCCEGTGSSSLALSLATQLAGDERWTAIVGLEEISPAAAIDMGLSPLRTAYVQATTRPADVVAALLGLVDVVVLDARLDLRSTQIRRLQARLREKGSVLIVLQPDIFRSAGALTTRSSLANWSADISFQTSGWQWEGIGKGHGYLQVRRARLQSSGRRQANRLQKRIYELSEDARSFRFIEDASVIPLVR